MVIRSITASIRIFVDNIGVQKGRETDLKINAVYNANQLG